MSVCLQDFIDDDDVWDKVMLGYPVEEKTFAICSTNYSGKRKPEHWLGPYLFGSNVD